MGVNIFGSVEFRNAALDEGRDWKDWHAVINAGIVLDQSYTMFGSLFGVRNRTSFAPIAACRGLPDDVSGVIRSDAEQEGNHSFTWITWDELQAVDWNETGLVGDDPITRSEALGDSGELLMELMRPLANYYGGECLRLVVWFDQYS